MTKQLDDRLPSDDPNLCCYKYRLMRKPLTATDEPCMACGGYDRSCQSYTPRSGQGFPELRHFRDYGDV